MGAPISLSQRHWVANSRIAEFTVRFLKKNHADSFCVGLLKRVMICNYDKNMGWA